MRKVNVNTEDLLIVLGLIILPFSIYLGQIIVGMMFAAILIPVPILVRHLRRWSRPNEG
ncbi:MAG: hypothetical protein SVJ22_11610 [Halobacteriota archaeon]|nr:hypothetical protein [Halobacteriota archaeon]